MLFINLKYFQYVTFCLKNQNNAKRLIGKRAYLCTEKTKFAFYNKKPLFCVFTLNKGFFV